MGLLDWLTDGIGSSMTTGGSGSAGPLVNATNNYGSPGSAPLSPAEMPPAPSPFGDRDKADLGGWPATIPPPAASPSDPAASGGGMPPGGTGAAPPPPTPMPMARPPGAPGPAAAPAPAMPPPTGAPSGPPPTSLAPPPSPMPPPDSGPAAPPVQPYHLGDQTALGRSLGINPNPSDPSSNSFRSAMAGLGQGLTAAGNSKGKSAGQALASGAGGAITGSTKQDSDQYNQRLKSLQLAVQAKAANNKSEYDKNYANYLIGKNELEKKKAAEGGGKGSWNKPDSQKFIDAQNAMSKDPDIRASQKVLDGAVSNGNQAQIAQAQATHTALVAQKQQMYFAGVGLDPAKIQANIQNPPGTPQNPHVVTSKADFDTYVKPGQAYKNPADGKIYIRKAGDAKDDSAADKEATAASAPEPPGPAPDTTAPAALEPEMGETP